MANKTKITQAEYLRDLALDKNKIASDELGIQSVLLEQQRNMLVLTRAQTKEALMLAKIRAGGTGTYGQERVNQEQEVLKADQQKRLAIAKKALENANTNLSTRTNDVSSSGTQINAATASQEAARARLASIEQEIDLYSRRNEIVLLGAKGDTEALQLKLQSISMNPAMTAFNVRMNELKSIGTNLNHEEQVQLYEQIKAQTLLTKMAENKQALFEGIASSLSNAFTSIVTGTASAKEAFKSMAISILSQISSMIAQMMIMRILMSAFGMGAPTTMDNQSPMPTPGMFDNQPQYVRNGGVLSAGKKVQGYATGGVARGSTSGYPATLHGTEAVVPLPNGRSIPVDMGKSGGTSNNNIVVNISTDGQSSNQGSTGPDMDKLGNAVAAAVQIELHNQKRSGGILNPYGAA